jgi:hypothetical protein
LRDETPLQRQQQESCIKESLKRNQFQSSGPTKLLSVFEWVETTAATNAASTKDASMPTWDRVRITQGEVDGIWDDYLPTQRHYDPFLILDDDDDDKIPLACPEVDRSEPITYLDKMDVQLVAPSYDEIYTLSSQIAFIASKNLRKWAYYTLGFSCDEGQVLSNPRSYQDAAAHVSFDIKMEDSGTIYFGALQEYWNLISQKDFHHPNLVKLSDLHPHHQNHLQIKIPTYTFSDIPAGFW